MTKQKYKEELAGECKPINTCHGYLEDNCTVMKTQKSSFIGVIHAPAHIHKPCGAIAYLKNGDLVD